MYEVWGSGMFLIFAEEADLAAIQGVFTCLIDRVSKTIILF